MLYNRTEVIRRFLEVDFLAVGHIEVKPGRIWPGVADSEGWGGGARGAPLARSAWRVTVRTRVL